MINSQNINTISTPINKLHHLFNLQNSTVSNTNKSSKFLLLNLADLSGELLNQLKAAQCKMLLLNEHFKIVEDNRQTAPAKIQLTIEGKKQQVAFEKIIRLEANSSYTYIYLKDRAKPVLTSKTLKHYADMLKDANFIRPHSKHLVNVTYIRQFNQGNSIELIDDMVIPVARRRLKEVKQLLIKPSF